MDKKTMWKLRWSQLSEYLPTFKKPLNSKKGSPTLEYVIVIAAGAALAGLLLATLNSDETKSDIMTELKDQIVNQIQGKDGGDQGGDNGGDQGGNG